MDTFLSRTVVVVMSLLVITVSLQVFMRYVASSPISFTEELSRYLLIWVGLLSASYAYRRRMHLALDLLVLKLHGRNKMILNIFIHSTILLFSLAVLGYGGYELVYMVVELGQSSPSLGVSMGVVYLALPISGLAISIYAIDFIRMELAGETPVIADPLIEDKNIVQPASDISDAGPSSADSGTNVHPKSE
ncbi:MAG: TRAP transporter small permease [Bacteroidetes bacterium]|nr:TRAP transporter small permease [Bacteroidota bacterium]MCH8524250.1 TRAP transporter small permease [Balneolales bacterium]